MIDNLPKGVGDEATLTKGERRKGNQDLKIKLKTIRIMMKIAPSSMEEEITNALKKRTLKEEQARLLRYKLKCLEKNDDFLFHKNRLNAKWAVLLVGSRNKKIGINKNVIFHLGWLDWPPEYKPRFIECANDLNRFLRYFRIDGVYQGRPFVDIPEYEAWDCEDNACRKVLCLRIPVQMTLASFRTIAEKEFKMVKEYLSWLEETKKLYGHERLRWGEKTGKKEYYDERNMKIVNEYNKLRESGYKVEIALQEIYRKFKLEGVFSDLDSMKTLVKRLKKRTKPKINDNSSKLAMIKQLYGKRSPKDLYDMFFKEY